MTSPLLDEAVRLQADAVIVHHGYLVPWGELSMPVSGLELASWIEARLGRKPLWCGDTGPDTVSRVAVYRRRPELYRRRGALWRGRLYHRRSVGTNYSLCPRAGPAFMPPATTPPSGAAFAPSANG